MSALVSFVQCTEPARRSQLQIRIDADAEVRAQIARVDVDVEFQDAQGSWQTLHSARFRPNDERPWPLALRVTLDDRHNEVAYQLTATARDANGALLLRSQATRDARPGQGVTLSVFFELSCIDQLCRESMTCVGGSCVSSDSEPRAPSETDSGTPGDVAPPSSRSSTGVQSAGARCDTAGARSCAGRGSRRPLACNGDHWIEEPECSEDERCDASPGPDRGLCRPIVRECMGREPNVQFCDGASMRVCPDLVASEPRTCGEHERCVDVDGKATCGCELGFVDKGTGCRAATDCTTDNGGCDRLTECSFSNGQRTCGACPAGHAGTGSAGCTALLQTLELSHGTLTPALAADRFDYRAEVPLAVQRITLTARAPDGSRVAIAGGELASEAWTSPPLAIGDNPFELQVISGSDVRKTYQLTIARSGRQEAFVKATQPSEFDQFGMSVALSGDTLAVGALYEDGAATGINGDQSSEAAADSGAVYVYVRTADGWRQNAYLKADQVARDDFFGRAVALSGDTLAVGATRDAGTSAATAGTRRSGVVYMFERDAGAWRQSARLDASMPIGADEFGASLALTGDRLVVGAPRSGAGRGGAAFVFERSADGWSETKRLEATSPVAGSRFGAAVAMHGDRIVVGAPEDGTAAARSGSAHVFLHEGSDWLAERRLDASTPSEGATFGFSVDVHGERIVVGAPRGVQVPDFGAHPRGEVYTFTRDGGDWRQVAVMEAPRPAQDDFFGVSVALANDALLVGANGEAGGGRGLSADPSRSDASYAGAAFLYTWTGETWVRTAYLKSDNAARDHGFGYAVALDGERIAVGALFEPSDARGVNGASTDRRLQNAGATYVFH